MIVFSYLQKKEIKIEKFFNCIKLYKNSRVMSVILISKSIFQYKFEEREREKK